MNIITELYQIQLNALLPVRICYSEHYKNNNSNTSGISFNIVEELFYKVFDEIGYAPTKSSRDSESSALFVCIYKHKLITFNIINNKSNNISLSKIDSIKSIILTNINKINNSCFFITLNNALHLENQLILSSDDITNKSFVEKVNKIKYKTNFLDIIPNNNKIAIITIFRDNLTHERERHRQEFIYIMNALFKPYNYHIYIIEQNEKYDFNIGKLKNIGFYLSSKIDDYDTYILTDIDTIPDNKLMHYYINKFDSPVALAFRGTRYTSSTKNENIKNPNYKPFLGAAVAFNKKDFLKINGYPSFYRWSSEDDALIMRIYFNKFKIYIPLVGGIIDLEYGKSIGNKLKELNKEGARNKMQKHRWLHDIHHWKINGIYQLHFLLLKAQEINKQTTQFTVDLMREKNEERHPEYKINYNHVLTPKELHKVKKYRIWQHKLFFI